MISELCKLSAREAVKRLKRGDVTPLELIDAAAKRISEVEPKVNALPTLCLDRAREEAKKLPARAKAAAEHPGWLAGLPVAIKDLSDVANVRTTYGSLHHADDVPAEDAVAAARLKQAGAILFGKTTTPEFGHKCLTDAPLFGRTRNAWTPPK